MIGVNKVILVGRVASDVETRVTKTGKSVANFAIAIPRKGGESADFFDVSAWEKMAETCANLKKGERVYLEGRLSKSVWKTEQGENRSRIRIAAGFVNFLGKPAPPAGQEMEVPTLGEAV